MYLTEGLPEDLKRGGKRRPYMPGSGALKAAQVCSMGLTGHMAMVATNPKNGCHTQKGLYTKTIVLP